MMPRITKWSTLAQVKRCPGFEPFREYLNPFKGIQGITTNYLPFALGPGWNGTNIASGFERLYTLCSKGHKVFYPLYTAEECRQNPALSKAAMFHFPGCPVSLRKEKSCILSSIYSGSINLRIIP